MTRQRRSPVLKIYLYQILYSIFILMSSYSLDFEIKFQFDLKVHKNHI